MLENVGFFLKRRSLGLGRGGATAGHHAGVSHLVGEDEAACRASLSSFHMLEREGLGRNEG
jgi:hypothetical protein